MTECAGLDIGSRSIEVVVVRGGEVLSRRRAPTTFDPLSQVRALFPDGPPPRLAVTGYGRQLALTLFPEARTITEIKAHAIGAASLFPEAATLLDIGGQDTKAVALLPGGRVGRFEMNDRCAAGTGKFLEYTATAFGLSVADFAALALGGSDPPEISSMCTVFAETEATTLMARGVGQADIALGLHKAIVARTVAMLRRVGLRAPLAFVGGVAKNPCAVRLVAEAVGFSPLVPDEPDMTGALGAALWLAKTPS
ncbi:acyl-CoA dehydratase activase [Solidesulfovibrio sp.]|uniref:acyl-CoA dehydratase activase n=1 Tax=Solidesulfovibrio sp. TaxID=2910990 RepID=UPI0026272380|nr:acyl-CoA dehydratase activase [Solidesulfovibrio sp.]